MTEILIWLTPNMASKFYLHETLRTRLTLIKIIAGIALRITREAVPIFIEEFPLAGYTMNGIRRVYFDF